MGTVKGSEVTLVVSPVGLSINLAGTLGSDQASMSGTYTTLSQGCINPQIAPETGIWTASLVKPLGGNFQGTFTSNKIGDLPATGMLSQAANVASTAPLSGNLTLTGYCFDTATVTGTISGTFVALNLLDSTGAQIGEVTAASSLDGKTLTGQYSILPQTTKPCTQGDRGTVTFSF